MENSKKSGKFTSIIIFLHIYIQIRVIKLTKFDKIKKIQKFD